MKESIYKGFKKVGEDHRTVTMAHPNGHKLQIVKDNLSPKLQTALKSLPLHQADPESAVGDDESEVLDEPKEKSQAPVIVNVGTPQPTNQATPNDTSQMPGQVSQGVPGGLLQSR